MGKDFSQRSTWRTGDIVVFGIPFKDAFATDLRPNVPVGIEFELPRGISRLKLLVGQAANGAPSVPLSYAFENGDNRFTSSVEGNEYPHGIDVRIAPDDRMLRVEASYSGLAAAKPVVAVFTIASAYR